jgi:hypothetical protein
VLLRAELDLAELGGATTMADNPPNLQHLKVDNRRLDSGIRSSDCGDILKAFGSSGGETQSLGARLLH